MMISNTTPLIITQRPNTPFSKRRVPDRLAIDNSFTARAEPVKRGARTKSGGSIADARRIAQLRLRHRAKSTSAEGNEGHNRMIGLEDELTELTPDQRRLVERWLHEHAASAAHPPDAARIPRRHATDVCPLSFAQQQLWFLHHWETDAAAYNSPIAVRLSGSYDLATLARSLSAIVQRHEALRTTFVAPNGPPQQRIASATPLPLRRVDLDQLPVAVREQLIVLLAQAEVAQPFDLEHGPLLRAHALRLAADEHVLLITLHHIVFDDWSQGVLIRELLALYTAFRAGQPSPLPELPVQYADYAIWQRQQLHGRLLDDQLAFWTEQLRHAPALLDLPTDYPRPTLRSSRGATHVFMIPVSVTERLNQLSRQTGATLFMTLLAAFNVLLYRYSGQTDIVVGTPIAGRTEVELEELIGLFMNMLALRTNLAGNPRFRDLVQQVRTLALAAYAHQDIAFEQVLEALPSTRDLSRHPIFQTMLVLQNAPMPLLKRPGLTVQPLDVPRTTARFDLALFLREGAHELRGRVEYSTELFTPTTIQRMVGHFQLVLAGIVADPEQAIDALPLLTAAQQAQLLVEWNDTVAGVRDQGLGVGSFTADAWCVHELFAAQAVRTPDAIAVVFDGTMDDGRWTMDPISGLGAWWQEGRVPAPDPRPLTPDPCCLTYRELNARANRLACYLRARGVGPEMLVGICMERSLDMLVGILGVLTAGAAYLPLDPSYPQERLAFMLDDARVAVLITATNDERRTTNDERTLIDGLIVQRILSIQNRVPPRGESKIQNPEADNPAYVIYTSGSTGTPKGVQISYGALANLLASMRRRPGLTCDDVLLAVTTLAFDIATLELLLPLLVGARVVLLERTVAADGVGLSAALLRNRATALQATPATMRLLTAVWRGSPGVKLLCGGEALPRDLADQLLGSGAALWNMYGPTETTIWSTTHKLAIGAGPVLIGRPIANTQVYLLDRQMRPVPLGVVGELYIGGAGLARGYLHRPDLTAERFVPNPFAGDKETSRQGDKETEDTIGSSAFILPPSSFRLYKTGDLARYRPDGAIEYLGRSDQQVKLRGFRIELEEIAAVLRRHPAVRESVVMLREDVASDKRLVAYVIEGSGVRDRGSGSEDKEARRQGDKEDSDLLVSLSPGLTPQVPSFVTELRAFLAERLPAYMLPSEFVLFDALPLTPNGKLDRRALPPPDPGRRVVSQAFVAPRTAVEERLARIWASVLRRERIGVHDNFFEIGGDSFLSVQVVAKANQVGLHFSPRLLFQHQTIAAIAPLLEGRRAVSADQGLVTGPLPLTPNQALSFETHDPDRHIWNLAMLFESEQPLKPALLNRVVGTLLAHHDALRTCAIQEGDGWRQFIAPPAPSLPFSVVDLAALPSSAHPRAITGAVSALQSSFQLEQGPLLRVACFDCGPGVPGRLLILIHHTACDHYSAAILWQDFPMIYQQLLQGQPIQLPPKTTSIITYAERMRAYAQSGELDAELNYWLAPARRQVPLIPVDFRDGVHTGASACTIIESLSRAETDALQQLVANDNTQIIAIMLAALGQTCAGWATRTLLVDLEYHGRETPFDDVDLSRTVGWINFLFPLLLELAGAAGPTALLRTVEAQLGAVPQHGIGYGMLRYLRDDPLVAARFRALPQAQILLNYRGIQGPRLGSDMLALHPATESPGVSYSLKVVRQHLFLINIDIIEDQLRLQWTYSAQVHRRQTVMQLVQGFLAALRELPAALAHASDD